jgi:autotransporter-associated beta strand protein
MKNWLLVFFLCATGHADILTWNGGAGDNNIGSAGNWTPVQAPDSGDALIYSGTTGLTPQLPADLAVDSITFNNTAGAFVLGGTGSYLIDSGGIINSSTNLETINNAITLSAVQTWSATSGNLAINGDVDNNGFLLTLSGSNTATLQGIISGVGSLSKTGNGLLELTGSNGYSGGTDIVGGKLRASNNNALGTDAVTVESGATLLLNDASLSNDLTVGGSGAAGTNGAIDVESTASTLGGAIALSAATAIGAGPGGQLTLGNSVDNNGHDLTVQGSGDTTISGEISDVGGLIKNGAGALVLQGDNSYTGETTITSGTLQVGNGGTTGKLGSGAVVDNASLVFNRNDSLTVENTISGAGGLMQKGSGALTLSGTNSYSGGTVINNGSILISRAANLGVDDGLAGSALTINNGTLEVTDTIGTTGRIVHLNDPGATIQVDAGQSLTLTGLVEGPGSLTKRGTGTLVLNNSVANSYGGAGQATNIEAGVLSVGNDNQLGNAATGLVFDTDGLGNSGTLQASNTVTSARHVTLNYGGTIDTQTNTVTLSGTIDGVGSLSKTGNGLLELTGSNGYSGVTDIVAGKLRASNNNALGTAAATVESGATLLLNQVSLANDLTVGGAGAAGTNGAVDAENSTSTLGGAIMLSAATAMGAGPGGQLTLGNPVNNNGNDLTIQGSGDTMILGEISDTGGLIKNGTGTLVLQGDNSYTGATTITSGTLQVGSGGTTGKLGSGAVVDNASLLFNRSDSLTIENTISGTGSLSKTGDDFLELTGTNSYGGGTDIVGGKLRASNNNALGTAAITVESGATLLLNQVSLANDLTVGGAGAAGTNGAVDVESSTSTLGGSVTFSGATAIGAGPDGLLILSNSVDNNGHDLTVQGAGDTMILGEISDTGGLTKNGAGTLVLQAGNSYTGATTITSGTLQVGNGGTVGTLGSGAVADNASLVINRSDSLTVENAISGTGMLTQAGSGALTLNGTNSYSGGTEINDGSIRISQAANLGVDDGLAGSALTINNGTLEVTNTIGSTGRILHLNDPDATIRVDSGQSLTLTGLVDGTGSLTKRGTGTLVLNNSVANSYGGAGQATNIDEGVLSVGNDNQLGNTATSIVFDTDGLGGSGTLQASNTVTSARHVTLNYDGTIDTQTNTVTLSGIIDGAGSLSKTGDGLLELTGTNSYSGGTDIVGGKLRASNNNALGTDVVTVESGATLLLNQVSLANDLTVGGAGAAGTNGSIDAEGGTSTLGGAITLSAATAIGAGPGGQLTLANSVDNNGHDLTIQGAGNTIMAGEISDTGGLIKNGAGTLVLQGNSSYTGATIINNGILQVNNGTGSATGSGDVTVNNLGTLSGLPGTGGGAGSIEGNVTVNSGGTLLTRSGDTLALGGLTLNTSAISNFQLGNPTSDALVNITNPDSLILAGISTIDVVNQAGFGTGTYHLIDYSGTALTSGQFSNLMLGGTTAGGYLLILYNNQTDTSVDLRITTGVNEWVTDGPGNWSAAGNWANISVPNGTGAAANFFKNMDAGFAFNPVVTVDDSITVGTITFDNADTSFLLQGDGVAGHGLTLANSGSASTITVNQGDHTISASVALTDNLNVILNTGSGSLSMDCAISENSAGRTVTLNGPGTLELGGTEANTYTGLTTVNGGALVLNKTDGVNAIGTGGLQIDAGATVSLLSSNQIDDTANLVLNGTFAMGTNSERITNLSGTGIVTNDAGSVLTVGGTDSSVFSGSINGDGGLAKVGSGTLTLSGSSRYTGETNIMEGNVRVSNDSALGSSDVTVASGVTLFLNHANLSNDMTVGGAGAAGTNGAVDAEGTISTLGGAITLSGATAIGAGPGGQLTLSYTVDNNGYDLTVQGAGDTLISADITDSGGLIKNGTGTLVLLGNNTFWGDTTINAGTIQTDHDNLGTSNLNIGAGTLKVTEDFASAQNIILNSTFSTIEIAPDTTLISTGMISGTGSLVKIGTGTLVMGNLGTYTGATRVNAGQLDVSGSLVNTNSVYVAASGTLSVEGLVNPGATTTVAGTLTGTGTLGNVILTGGLLTTGNDALGILTTGSLSFSNTASLSLQIGGVVAGTDHGGIISTGSVALNNSTLQLSLTDDYQPASTDRILLLSNAAGLNSKIGAFNGLANNSTINLTNNLGTSPFTIHYADFNGDGTTDVYLTSAQPTNVVWGDASADSSAGQLDTSMLLTTSTTTYTDVNSQGYDIVVITKKLTSQVLGSDDTWDLEGAAASSGGKSIPYSTVTFLFYKTGTTIPFTVTGMKTMFQDAESGERFRNFGYYDSDGNLVSQAYPYKDPNIFSYSAGTPTVHLSDNSVENAVSSQAGVQINKWVGLDYSALAISGFTFQIGRFNSNAGWVDMTMLGNLTPTGELLIESGSDFNITSGPHFITTSASSTLAPNSIAAALNASNTVIFTGTSQNIVVNENIVSDAGNVLSLEATRNILSGTASIMLSSTTGNAGNLFLTAEQTVQAGHLATASSTGSGGNITLSAGNKITVSSGIDSSSNHASQKGGDISLDAVGAVTVDTIRSGGGGGVARAGSPGNITVSSGTSISITSIYANSASGSSPAITLTAPVINLGASGTTRVVAADIEGTLYLQKPAGTGAANISISGTITGSGALEIDAGTGTASLNAPTSNTGETRMISGTLAAHGNSLANSDLVLTGSSGLTPGVATPGGYVAVKTLTTGTDTSLNFTLTSGTVYDQIRTTGSATLGGIFSLQLKTGFIPNIGTSFEVMKYGQYTGDFSSYEGLRLSDRVLVPEFTGTDMILMTSAIATGASQPLLTVPSGGIAVSAGGYYDGLITTSATPNLINAATIIGGTASHARTVTMQLLSTGTSGSLPGGGLGGNILDLKGTGTDKYVLQIDYNEQVVLAALGKESNLFISWSDGVFQFVNTVWGNTNLPGEINNPTKKIGAYNPATDFHLGYWGIDTVNNRLWAVIDHNSTFGLGFDGTLDSANPTVATQPATVATAISATLNALVNPNGFATTVLFESGTDPLLAGAAVTSGTLIGSGSNLLDVAIPVTGLTPGTTYYFRADAVAASGTQTGEILSFTSAPLPTVTVSAVIPDAYELNAAAGVFRIAQSGSAAVTVHYTLTGSAVNGSRYTLASGPVTIPQGAASITLNVTPIPNNGYDGDQTVVITLDPDSGYATGAPGSATVTIHDKPANQWRNTWFGSEANNPAISGDAVVNNDAGITNLMAFALGLDPATAAIEKLPHLERVTDSGTDYLALSFTRNINAVDLVYVVQASSDLIHWSDVCTFSGRAWSPSGNVMETGSGSSLGVVARDSIPLSSLSRRFLRLQVLH